MRFRTSLLVSAGLLACLLSCSGGARQVEIGAPPAKMTRGTFSGPLCASGKECTCRDVNAAADGGAGVPSDGNKRFEVRLHSPNQLWAKIGENELYKSAEKVDGCWYVDLPAGNTAVEL